MPGPELARARQLLAGDRLSPEKRAQLEAAVRSYESQATAGGGGGGPGGVPLRQAGAPMADVDPYELDVKAAESSLQQLAAPQERLPKEHLPQSYLDRPDGLVSPIMYQGESDEEWRGAMEQGDREGRPAYRVQEKWPLSLNPSTWTPENLAVRGALGLNALASGADSSLTLGIGGKLVNKGLEAAGVGNAGQARQEIREGAPLLDAAGRIGGALVPGGAAARIGGAAARIGGAAARIGGAAARIGGGAQQLLGAPSAGLLGSSIGAAAAGALGGAAQAGGEALVAGEDPLEAARGAAGIGALLGPFGNLIGRGAQALQRGLRDPATEVGRDLARAEAAGAKTDIVRGVKPSPAMEQLAEEGRAAGGYSPEAMAVSKAAPLLGRELAEQQQQTLGGIRAQNQALNERAGTLAAQEGGTAQASLQPVLTRGLDTIRKGTHGDGSLLPGVNLRGVADVVKRTASARIVARSSPDAAAAGDNVMDVGLARKLGLVSRATKPGDGEMVVVLEPISVSPAQLDEVTRALDDQANVGAGVDVAKRRPIKGLGAAAREARAGLGPEVAAAKAQQSQQLNQMGNAMEASGLPRHAENIDLADVGTRNALEGGVRRFRTDTNLANDRELERVAANNEQLRGALDLAAGTGATGRLRARSGLKEAMGSQGITGLPAAAFTGARLRFDPIMGALGAMPAGGVVPATSAELARQFRRR